MSSQQDTKQFYEGLTSGQTNFEPLPNFDKIVGTDEWYTLLPKVDYIVVATPLTPKTLKVLNKNPLPKYPN
ncbi:hypothetical protein [Nostoc sp.]|uniref:hypothetical protein n=1 Tax=Nostoc sp. TaxID=1180 RepID=UPI002FF66BD7